MNRSLQIIVRRRRQDRGRVDFKTKTTNTRIQDLCCLSRFLGNMAQLAGAIDAGNRKRCLYVLAEREGNIWVLACTYNSYWVRLWLWNDSFYWKGTAREFRNAIRIIQ